MSASRSRCFGFSLKSTVRSSVIAVWAMTLMHPRLWGQSAVFQPMITTVAGNSTAGYNGDNITATNAEIWDPCGVATYGAGNLYIADLLNNRIRKVTPNGIITTVVGNEIGGYNGDNIPATSAELSSPSGVAVTLRR